MIAFTINGRQVEFDGATDTPLLWVLRDHLRLTGTKYACGLGLCGACIVHVDGRATASCRVPVRTLGGRTTWENVVCSCVDCNRRKGGRTPAQAHLKLLRRPERPRWTPMMQHIGVHARHEEWKPFLY